MTSPDADISDAHVLMQRIAAREQAGLAELYDRMSPLVYAVCYRVLQNQALAEESTQDTFLKVWQQAAQWDASRGRLTTWVLTIARYTAIDRLRHEHRRGTMNAVPIEELLPVLGHSGRQDEQRRDRSREMTTLLEQLPKAQRQSIEMAFFEGLSHVEIADRLKEPLGTIKSRIRQGLQQLRGLWLRSVE